VTIVLAIIAVLVPASVTLVGYWIKQQSEKRLALEHEQENYQSKIDLALRATELFGPSGDAPASSAKSAAGLLALAHLDFVDLALALLVDLWNPSPSGVSTETAIQGAGVSTETAIQVINAALNSAMPDVQLEAAQLLLRNADALYISNPLHWPSSLNGRWIPGLPFAVKLIIIDALVRIALVSEPTQNALGALALRLYGISRGDEEPMIRGSVGTLMNAVIPAIESLGQRNFIDDSGSGVVTINDMIQVAARASRNPDVLMDKILQDRSERLAQWAGVPLPVSFSPGSLAPKLSDSEAE
jgi:hypothetical protein